MTLLRNVTIKTHAFFRKRFFAPAGDSRPFFLSILLLVPGALYFLVTGVGRVLYRKKILESTRVPAIVIGVGNLTVGGSGKTTVTMELAEYLRNRGFRVAVLSRGYGGRSLLPNPLVVSEGDGPLRSVEEVGDEAYMMAERLKGEVVVIVGKDRKESALLATEEFGRECLVLDDSYQYHRLHKDFEILLVNESDLAGSLRPFPAGPFREPVSSAKYADIVVLMQGLDADGGHSGRERIEKIARPATTARPESIRLLCIRPETGEVGFERIAGRRIVAFASIGRTDIFTDMVRGLSPEWFDVVEFPDHFRYSREDIVSLRKYAERERAVVLTTEKDRVKLDLELFADRECYSMLLSYRLFESDTELKRAVDALFDGLETPA